MTAAVQNVMSYCLMLEVVERCIFPRQVDIYTTTYNAFILTPFQIFRDFQDRSHEKENIN